MAAVLVALLLVPFGVSLWRAHDVGWLPSGDDALIGLRSLDVTTAHRPLIGQPSTSHLYSDDIDAHHPGPIEFYWLAAPIRALGPSAGMLVGIAAINIASVLVALWVVLRRAGPGVAAWSAVLLGGVLWSEGTAVLSDPISSSAGSIPLLALAALAWAIFDGDVRLLPLGAAFAAWVLQQHLAIVVPAAALVAFALSGCTVHGALRWWRAREGADPDEPHPVEADPAPSTDRPWWPWVVAALATSLVLWAPVAWQQLTGHPGNLTAIVEYARTSDSPSLGWARGARQAVRALGAPPMLLRTDLRGDQLYDGPMSVLDVAVGVGSYALLAAAALVARRRRPALASLSALVLVLALAGIYTGSSVPRSVEAFRANFYRWTFVVSWLGLTALGWGAALAARRLLAARSGAAPSGVALRWAPGLAVVALVVPTVATLTTSGYDDARRDQDGFGAMQHVSDAAIDRAREVGATRVTLVPRGRSAVLASTSALAMQLESAGFEVVVPPDLEERFWGAHRILREGEDPGLVLQLVTAAGPVPAGPGEAVATAELNPEARGLLDPLVAQARGAELVVSDRAEEILAEHYATEGERAFLRKVMAGLSTDPEPVLTSEGSLDLLIDGYFVEPAFDVDALRALRAQLPLAKVNDDDTFELREIDAAALAELVPSWAGDG